MNSVYFFILVQCCTGVVIADKISDYTHKKICLIAKNDNIDQIDQPLKPIPSEPRTKKSPKSLSKNSKLKKSSNRTRRSKNQSPEAKPKPKKSTLASTGGEYIYKLSKGVMDISKKSLKSGYDLVSEKHVEFQRIIGKWKFSQDVFLKRDVMYSCPATITFLKNGTVITTSNGKEYRTNFEFKERAWPRACRIEFDAYAFQGPYDTEPIRMFYKGYFKKSLFDKKILLMRGKMYRMAGKLWKKRTKCGKFKASKRQQHR
mmetsp:Transcript_35611/g.36321  ORF Transcript_35611/g.36321 Transcript_35611/m.36321 type:complete len:259 (-) Transcript_35611:64-840(-)